MQWLDIDFALQLKGLIVMAHHPELQPMQYLSSPFATRAIRFKSVSNGNSDRNPSNSQNDQYQSFNQFGVQPSSTPPSRNSKSANEIFSELSVGSASHKIQKVIVRALTHSLGANLVNLNQKSIENIRDRYMTDYGTSHNEEQITFKEILENLFQILNQPILIDDFQPVNSGVDSDLELPRDEVFRPSIIMLTDDTRWLVCNDEICQFLIEKIDEAMTPSSQMVANDLDTVQSIPNRWFFIQIEQEETLSLPPTMPSTPPAASFNPPRNIVQPPRSWFGNTPGVYPFLPPPPPGFMASHPYNTPPSSPSSQSNPFKSIDGMPPPGTPVIGRSFQVIIRNGTATILPTSPDSFPGLPPGMIPGPPEEVIKRIVAEQQRILQNQQNQPAGQGFQGSFVNEATATPPNGFGFPTFPPDISEEELEDFLQDPENEAKLKVSFDSSDVVTSLDHPPIQGMLDRMIAGITQQLSSQIQSNPAGFSFPLFTSNNPNAAFLKQMLPQIEVKVHMMQIPMPNHPMNPLLPMNPMDPSKQFDESNAVNQTTTTLSPSTPGMDINLEFDVEDESPDSDDEDNSPPPPSNPIQSNLSGSINSTIPSTGKGFIGLNRISGLLKGLRPPPQNLSTNHSTHSVNGSTVPSSSPIHPNHPMSSNDQTKQSYTKPNGFSIAANGQLFLKRFVEMIIEPPRDQAIKYKWDRILEEERSDKIGKVNKRIINAECRRMNLKRVPGALKVLEDVLRRQLFTREDIRLALWKAVMLQAARYDAMSLQKTSTVHPNDNTTIQTEDVWRDGMVTKLETVNDSMLSLDPSLDSKSQPSAKGGKELVLSTWALDTALSGLVKDSAPRYGTALVRSKDDLASLATDKHEKALMNNVIMPQDIGVTYDMIGGLDDIKETLRQCITYPLRYPRLYREGVAAEAIKGVLLFGPPGTGKTMLAKAVATEGGATFLTVDTSTIENKWLGESEKNAKAVFTLARRLAPCVIYLDEVDSILSSREHGDESSHGTLTSVKTTLMQEWDGLRTTKDRVVVIASTNRPFDLDEAVLRRLPRRIMVDLPDAATRAEILTVTLSNNRLGSDVNIQSLAKELEGYTGSDIKEVCREAVVRVSHERAHLLEYGGSLSSSVSSNEMDWSAPLRPVCLKDFKEAMKKLKASVDENGKELQKVIDWNEKYGESSEKQRIQQASSHLSMYV